MENVLAHKAKVTYLTIQDSQPPSRKTQPHSAWRDLFVPMKIGEWMFIRKSDYGRVCAAANSYVKGCYTMYQVPEGYKLLRELR
jgi:hypothetical protein